MQIVKVKKTYLLSDFSANATEFTLKELVDHKGNPLEIEDFDGLLVVTLRQGDTIEMVLCDDIEQDEEGTATLTVAENGRDLSAKYPYTGGTIGEDFSASADAVVGDDPYTVYQITVGYTDSVAFAGAPNASLTAKGVLEAATSEQIDADEATGETGAMLALTPAQVAASKYGQRLMSAAQKLFLDAVVGLMLPTVRSTAPTGFLMCHGGLYNNDDYSALAVEMAARGGLDTGTVFTATAATDLINITSHGLSDGQMLFLSTNGTLPTGLSPNTPYYIRDQEVNSFKLAATEGGAAIDIESTGTGVHKIHTQFRVPDIRGRSIIGAGAGTKVATVVSRASNVVTLSGLTDSAHNEFQTGQAVVYSAPSGAMTGLTDAATYYLIRITNTTFSLASSLANAQNGTAIALSGDGTGVQTFTKTFTTRALGETLGEETHAMSATELLAHSHRIVSGRSGGGGSADYINLENDDNDSSPIYSDGYVESTGGNVGMNNMVPSQVWNWIIKT